MNFQKCKLTLTTSFRSQWGSYALNISWLPNPLHTSTHIYNPLLKNHSKKYLIPSAMYIFRSQAQNRVSLLCLRWSCSNLPSLDRVRNRLCRFVRDGLPSTVQPLSYDFGAIPWRMFRWATCFSSNNTYLYSYETPCHFHLAESP